MKHPALIIGLAFAALSTLTASIAMILSWANWRPG